ncbi:RDD family protein [Desertivirga brevis]|uniref:RDD family protein n=1 Tax=Desertivirga brevis TaxID=2810310 RepID=UPI001A9573D0|nr:RDD family protein [Pedobacter sp. SYSU D00873]
METSENLITVETEEVEYPLLLERFQSTFIDTFFILVMMVVFSQVLDFFNNPPDWLRVSLFISIWFLYEPLCTAFGCTIGNYMKGIRVRNREDHTERINLFQAFMRYVFKIALGAISFLFILSNNEKRALHDMVSGSVVLKLQG